MNEILKGRILKGIGGIYSVLCGEVVYECRARGKLRMGTDIPLCGDNVEVEVKNAQGMILHIMPRKNSLIRPAVANIDTLFIAASEAEPKTDPYLIDKVTVIALCKGIKPVIILTKSDMDNSARLREIYEKIGFAVISASIQSGEGIAELRNMLAGRISAFTGNSGIGKSSLLNKIDAQLNLAVGEISERINRGKHTTRHVELIRMSNGGLIADTPGFSSFEITKMEKIKKDELENYFPEISAQWGKCRFSGCAHIKEPGCVVRELVDNGEIDKGRYDSYVKLYSELKEIKEWQ